MSGAATPEFPTLVRRPESGVGGQPECCHCLRYTLPRFVRRSWLPLHPAPQFLCPPCVYVPCCVCSLIAYVPPLSQLSRTDPPPLTHRVALSRNSHSCRSPKATEARQRRQRHGSLGSDDGRWRHLHGPTCRPGNVGSQFVRCTCSGARQQLRL